MNFFPDFVAQVYGDWTALMSAEAVVVHMLISPYFDDFLATPDLSCDCDCDCDDCCDDWKTFWIFDFSYGFNEYLILSSLEESDDDYEECCDDKDCCCYDNWVLAADSFDFLDEVIPTYSTAVATIK